MSTYGRFRFLTFFCVAITLYGLFTITNAAVIPENSAIIPDNQAAAEPGIDKSSDYITKTPYKRFLHAILSIDHPRVIVYVGAMVALITMTVLSALLGHATEVLPRIYTFYLSGLLFLIFGFKMLKDAYYMSPEDTKEEYHEVQEELSAKDPNSQRRCSAIQNFLRGSLSPVFVEACIMTFLAEWGDRSQLTTIVLAAREDVSGVIVGGCLGHGLCTGLAVLSGRFIAQRIPVKWRADGGLKPQLNNWPPMLIVFLVLVTAIGGATFVLFGIATFSTRTYSL